MIGPTGGVERSTSKTEEGILREPDPGKVSRKCRCVEEGRLQQLSFKSKADPRVLRIRLALRSSWLRSSTSVAASMVP